jgi:HEAT repeat protein
MSKRAFGPFLARSTICFTLILGALAHGRTTVAQELSPDILRIIPGVAEKLRSSDINERLSVLDQLVTVKETVHRPQLVLPYDLPASDYSIVVQSVLTGNLEQVDERRASIAWWKLSHVITTFKLKLPAQLVTRYLPQGSIGIQIAILQILETMHAVDGVPQIVTLLQSPSENIRRKALALLVTLRAKDEGVRAYALISVVKIDGREAAADVVRILEDPSENTRYWALDALVNFNAREHARAVWKLTGPDQRSETQAYALAALLYFGELRAIPLIVKRATEADMTRRGDMLDFLVKVKATAIVPAFTGVLESRTVLGGNPDDTGTDSNIRRDIMTCLGRLGARDVIPVLRGYARGKDSNTFLQWTAIRTLGALRAMESVDDLLVLLDTKVSGDEYTTAEAGLALAQIGERRTWRKLIDLAANPTCRYRSEALPQKSKLSANGAEYESQGQARSASPLESNQKISSLEKA